MGKKAIILLIVCVMIVVVVFFEFFLFGTSVQHTTDPYFAAYYNEFNETPTPGYDYAFSPPVSMYHAVLIALRSGGWNAASLQDMTISVELDNCAFIKNAEETGFNLIRAVTQPVADWLPQQVNDTTYRYVWTIIVQSMGPHS